ncbi:MAG: hypothetical protein ETSY1_40785 [Candidatus Entotheonella factor]|uniref:Transposase (putative) YhgA-like domain-containing protein n=1 Tax=Entotheonella factor TaxID=1429438 RepID=W4L5X0_ENTF1|nr:MAG: hypothetical protein ETSY1_40785 [Candidatus Entotheonella factor]
MADETHQIHDKLAQQVLGQPESAASLLERYLPERVSQALDWPSLQRLNRSFVDEHWRPSEADFVYEVRRLADDEPVWVYILLEHQATPDKWLRFRLLRYCCRLWELQLSQESEASELRPIVPLVFYQGRSRWTYSTEFADLFADSVRDWPGQPRFSHELVDQSGMQPSELGGELKVRVMQLVMMAAYHPERPWMALADELLRRLRALGPSGGTDYFYVFVDYILKTQEPEAIETFGEILRQGTPELGDELMSYAQQLEERGKEQGRLQAQVEIIENLLRLGYDWSQIEAIARVSESEFESLKQRLSELSA